MAFSFDDLREKVTDLAQSGVAKSKQLAEIAKLKTSNMGEEDTIKKAYLELGRLYYAERGAAPEGAYAAACGRISQAKAAIETNNARIAELHDLIYRRKRKHIRFFFQRLCHGNGTVTVCVRLNDTQDRRLCLLADHAIIMLDRTEVDLRPSAVLIYFHCFRHSNRTVWFLIY